MLIDIFMNCRHKDEIIFGIIGTGGGVIIYFVLKKLYGSDAKKTFASVMATVLPMTVLSALIYERTSGGVFESAAPYIIPAALGGLCGAALFGRIKTDALKTAFSVMLAVSGALILIR